MSLSVYRHVEKGEETQPFIIAGPVAKPMGLRGIWKASNTWVEAFVDDPYLEYLRADARRVPVYRQRATYIAVLTLWCRNNILFTVDGGASLSANWDVPTTPRTPINRFKDKLANQLLGAVEGKKTPEQEKRWHESGKKLVKAMTEVLPVEKRMEMFMVGIVATDPQCQGRGLGSAVLNAMTAIADSHGRACWLLSSNIANDAFYNSHGFFAVAKYYVGEDNPEWKKKPVLAQIMVREARTIVKRSPVTTRPPAVEIINPLFPFAFLI